jgi:hypothetical protein
MVPEVTLLYDTCNYLKYFKTAVTGKQGLLCFHYEVSLFYDTLIGKGDSQTRDFLYGNQTRVMPCMVLNPLN